MPRFNITKEDIGRRVQITGIGRTGVKFNQDKGVIIDIITTNSPPIAIKFDEPVGRHTCACLCDENHGYYVTKDMITFIDEKEKEKEKVTGIRIHAQKIIMRTGKQGYKVLNVKALERRKLPLQYLKQEPYVYYQKLTLSKPIILLGNDMSIQIGKSYTVHEFQKRIEYCKKAGDRLMRINKELNEKRKQWNGKETIVI